MDIKPENMLLAAPDLDTHRLYPCVKLADFGKYLIQTNLLKTETYTNRIGTYHGSKRGRNSLLQERWTGWGN